MTRPDEKENPKEGRRRGRFVKRGEMGEDGEEAKHGTCTVHVHTDNTPCLALVIKTTELRVRQTEERSR